MKKHEKLMAGLLAGSMLLGLTGCGTSNSGSASTADNAAENATSDTSSVETATGEEGTAATLTDEEVVFWGPWDGDVGDQITAIIDSYNAEKGTNITYVCQADLVNAYQAAALAGDVPDIMLWDANEVRRYAKMGQLQPIDEQLAEHGIDTADFNDQSIAELTYEDHLYGLPMNIDIWGIYVNMDILNAAGIEEAPGTWDELKEAAVAAMDVEGVKTGLNMKMAPTLFNSFLVANGGQPLSDDGLTVNLDDRALEVLNFYKELIDAGVYSTQYAPSNGSDGFLTGEEAMTFWPTSMLRTYRNYGSEMNFTFVPIPAGRASGAKAGGVQTSFSLMIPTRAKHPDVALDFMETTLHDDEYSLQWCEVLGGLSALKSIQNDETFTSDPYLKNVLADLENLKIRSDVPGFVNLEGTCYGPEIEKMFEGRQTPEETLEVMTTEGNKLLEQYRNT